METKKAIENFNTAFRDFVNNDGFKPIHKALEKLNFLLLQVTKNQ